MSVPIVLGIVWVLASAVVAFLPMRRQYAPGIVLLIAAPVLIVWIGMVHGWIIGLIALFAFLSMYRNPLRYLVRKALGLPVSRPEEKTP